MPPPKLAGKKQPGRWSPLPFRKGLPPRRSPATTETGNRRDPDSARETLFASCLALSRLLRQQPMLSARSVRGQSSCQGLRSSRNRRFTTCDLHAVEGIPRDVHLLLTGAMGRVRRPDTIGWPTLWRRIGIPPVSLAC